MNKTIFLITLMILLTPIFTYGATQIATDNFECGAFNCGSGWTSAWQYTGTCTLVSTNAFGSYNMRGYSNCDATKHLDTTGFTSVNVSFYATAGSLESGEYCRYYYFDGTTNRELLALTDGKDDNVHDYYNFEVTQYGLSNNAGIRMYGALGTGDYCYIDNVQVLGTITNNLVLYTTPAYIINEAAVIEATSTITNTPHTIVLTDSNNNVFCNKTITSPAVMNTMFSVQCTMPSIPQSNLHAKIYVTNNPSIFTITQFNVINIQNNPSILNIKKVYFSPQVLQGGQTEIFMLIEKDESISINEATLTITFPDETSRTFFMSQTTNPNEYRAFITDTYQVGNVLFTIKIIGGQYYSQYSNQYIVAQYNLDFVDVVNRVAICEEVKKVSIPKIEVFGTEYTNDQQVKMWVQLLNSSGEYVEDGSCYIDIYSPDNIIYVKYALMSNLQHEGIYYYDMESPAKEGVYPVIARCYYESFIDYFYGKSLNITIGSITNKTVSENWGAVSWTGGANWYDAQWVHTGTSDVTNSGTPQAGSYHLRLRSNAYASRKFETLGAYGITVSFWAKANSLEAGEAGYAYIESATGTNNFLLLDDWQDGEDTNTYNKYTYNLLTEGVTFDGPITLAFELDAATTGDYMYFDTIEIIVGKRLNLTKTQTIDNEYQIVSEAISSGVSRLDFFVDFNSSTCQTIDENLLTSFIISTNGKFDSVVNDDLTLSVYNFTSSSWIVLPNKLLENTIFQTVINTLLTYNITKSGLYKKGVGSRVRFTDTTFADTTNNDFFIDMLNVGCDQALSPSWEDVKGSSEIHISSTYDARNYYVETLCGENYEPTSKCSQFVYNESYWNRTWGHVYDKITFINSYKTNVNEVFIYETPYTIDCTAVIDIIKNTNESSNSIINQVVISAGDKENCRISIPVIFSESDREFNIEVTLDNYMAWEAQRIYSFVDYFSLIITPFCRDIEEINGINYTIPIEEQTVLEFYQNPIYLGCYWSLDDLYWFDYYYNAAEGITVSGEFESYLIEFRYYYPELKDHAAIVMGLSSQLTESLFDIKTLCGNNHKDYSCAVVMPPDGYFTSQEGYIIENITVQNIFNSTMISTYEYATATGIDCTAILEILEYKGGSITDLYNQTKFNVGDKDNCEMTIPIAFPNNGASSFIQIYMENYILWDIYWARDLVNSVRPTIERFCDGVNNVTGTDYIVPITDDIHVGLNESTLHSDDALCWRALDNIYWWDFFYLSMLQENSTEIGDYESIRYESEFFWVRIYNDFLHILTHTSIEGLEDSSMLMLQRINIIDSDVWNYTNRNLTYYPPVSVDLSSIGEGVWNYSQRNLTYYPPVSVNYTAIGNEVWGTNRTINPGLLGQIVYDVWDYVGRYIHGIIV